jgi:hypothetical protein
MDIVPHLFAFVAVNLIGAFFQIAFNQETQKPMKFNATMVTEDGPFGVMSQLYRRAETDEWLAYMHNDWLETLITFGRVGAAPIFLTGLLVLSHWFWSGGIHGNKYFVMLLWVSLGDALSMPASIFHCKSTLF